MRVRVSPSAHIKENAIAIFCVAVFFYTVSDEGETRTGKGVGRLVNRTERRNGCSFPVAEESKLRGFETGMSDNE